MAVFPRTLAGRVLLIIFAGLVVAHVASFTFYEVERARTIDRFAANDIAARIVEFARAPADSVSAGPRGGPRLRVRWQVVSSVGEAQPGGTEPSATFAGELRRLLAENLGADPVAWISMRDATRTRPEGARSDGPRSPPPAFGRGPGSMPGPGPVGPGGFERTAKLVTVALRLPDDRQVLAETMLYQPSLQIPTEAWISIVLVFVVTAIFSIWAGRLAVQPVRMLADAADRLSRNIGEPPLPEKGVAEIRAATRAFNRMQDRLRRHVNSRALAFAAVSHDMRTPLTRMRLRLESLSGEVKEKLAGDLDEIEALTRSVLEVTRELASEEEIVRVDVNALVRRLATDYAPLGQLLEVAGNAAPIMTRPVALRRALANLVDNAFKYGKEVAVRIEDSRDTLRLSVCDRGPGIPAEDLEKVLHPFYRVESSRNRETGGAGLGLAITKDIVEGLGGEIHLENRLDGGLRATLALPR